MSIILVSEKDLSLLINRNHVAALWFLTGEVEPRNLQSISKSIVDLHCAHIMISGVNSEIWHDEIDIALAEISSDHQVVTTWHSDETLEEVAWEFTNVSFSGANIELRVICVAESDRVPFLTIVRGATEAMIAAKA